VSVAIHATRRAVPQVEVPSRYRVPTKGQGLIDVEGRTVRECIAAVEAQYPGFLELVFDSKGDLNRFVRLFVNGDEVARDAPEAPVGDGDRVQILAAIAGG